MNLSQSQAPPTRHVIQSQSLTSTPTTTIPDLIHTIPIQTTSPIHETIFTEFSTQIPTTIPIPEAIFTKATITTYVSQPETTSI